VTGPAVASSQPPTRVPSVVRRARSLKTFGASGRPQSP
jgi:hypothetical protein